jgi:hypothetical protein
MQITVNPFVKRQTPLSSFSHFSGDMERLPEMVKQNWSAQKEGYRDGVILVLVDPTDFFSGVITLEDGAELSGTFRPRREGEAPRKEIRAKSALERKIAAQSVEIVLYRSDVLAEGGDNSLESSTENWEIISINASPTEGEMPISPTTLMHNHFGSDGGTATNMTDAEFVEALRSGFEFWSNKAMCA